MHSRSGHPDCSALEAKVYRLSCRWKRVGGISPMVNPVSPTTQVQAQAATQSSGGRQPAPAPKPPQPLAAPQSPVTDTVQISAAAQALQEVTETQVQTAKEARSGDLQAVRLLAKETAAHHITK